mmetsp:Transcript_31638/g.42861  ORF Transcript_31638/g.42861 Transcript_31638/m.42861 type:complete len:218 (-) Transcript_31638:65-718(-)
MQLLETISVIGILLRHIISFGIELLNMTALVISLVLLGLSGELVSIILHLLNSSLHLIFLLEVRLILSLKFLEMLLLDLGSFLFLLLDVLSKRVVLVSQLLLVLFMRLSILVKGVLQVANLLLQGSPELLRVLEQSFVSINISVEIIVYFQFRINTDESVLEIVNLNGMLLDSEFHVIHMSLIFIHHVGLGLSNSGWATVNHIGLSGGTSPHGSSLR